MTTKPRVRKPDLQAFYESLAAVRVGRNGYTAETRFRDFRAAFSTEEGKRALAQIVDLCEGPPALEADVDSHARLAYRAGMRRIGLEIVRWMNTLPKAQPERTES